MRRILGTTLIALLLTVPGCGEGTRDAGAADRAVDASGGAGQSSAPAFEQVALLTGTAAGGRVSAEATVLDDDAAIEDYLAQFHRTGMVDDLEQALRSTSVPQGQELAAAVVSIGCDEIRGVTVTRSGDGVEVRPKPVRATREECFAPMTTVAVVLVPQEGGE